MANNKKSNLICRKSAGRDQIFCAAIKDLEFTGDKKTFLGCAWIWYVNLTGDIFKDIIDYIILQKYKKSVESYLRWNFKREKSILMSNLIKMEKDFWPLARGRGVEAKEQGNEAEIKNRRKMCGFLKRMKALT